ncbi:UNVERIFIED_CONTAM: hypothetical protein K2H54_037338 [Gekko kuhli]
MEAPGGPPRFKCPLDFSASPFCPGPSFSQEALQDPAKELWLIRAPANFSPESLDGRHVPLLGSQTLKAPQPGGTEKTFHVQTTLEHLGGARLLLPSSQGVRLACSPPFSGSLSICERYGEPGGNQPLSPVAAKPAPPGPGGTQATLPALWEQPGEPAPARSRGGAPQEEKEAGSQPGFAADAQNGVLPGEPEDLAPLSKKKKKKRKEETEGEAEAGHGDEDRAAPLTGDSQPSGTADAQNGLLSGEAEDQASLSEKKKKKRKEEMGGEAEAGHRHEDWAAPLTGDSQPSGTADAQNSLLSGGAEDQAPLSEKKKKKKRRKEDREWKEEMGGEAETRHQPEDGAVPPATNPQLSFAADAQNSLSGETEVQVPLSEKKKKRRKEGRELKEEMGGEADPATRPHEDSAAWGALSPEAQPDSATFAHDGLLSGEVEATGPGSKKKKKKRKEDRERKEQARGEVEAANLHQGDGTPPWALGSQPDPAAVARDGLPSGEAEDLGGETEATHPPREEGAAPWGTGSQPHAEPVAQEGGSAEDPGPRSKKKKRKDKREAKEETGIEAEAALPPEENGTTPLQTGSQPSSGLLAQDGLLSREAEGPASTGKKKKKRKEEAEGEVGGLPGLSSCPGWDSLAGVEEVAQGTHEKAVSPELFSSQEDAAGVWRDFSGLGPILESDPVLAEEEEQPGAGSSSHKAKKKKRKKEKEEPGERPAQQWAEGGAELGIPLGGGGGGQEAEPGGELLSRKRRKEHRRQQAAEEGLAGPEEVGGNS